MKFATLTFTLVLLFVALVGAAPGLERDTNANRLARGLPPLPPVMRPRGYESAKRTLTSPPLPPQCSTGPVQCCQRVAAPNDAVAGLILNLLGVVVKDLTIKVGLTCSPLTAGSTCAAQPVCCTDNSFNGIIALGCSPV